MKIIELILDEEQEETGVEAISIVESPAIESDFVALKDQEIKVLVEDGTEKQHISFTGKHTAQNIKIKGRYTIKKVNVFATLIQCIRSCLT